MTLATKEWSKLKIYQEFLARKSGSDPSSLPSKVNSEGVNAAEVDNNAPAIENPETSMSPKEALKDSLRPKGDSNKRPLTGSDDKTPEPRKRICPKPGPKAKYPKYPPIGSLVLETHLRPSEKIKLIYAADTPYLSQFLQKVRKRWNIPEGHGVESFDVDVGDKVFEVDPNEGRDWIFVLEKIRRRGIAAVTVIIRVSKTGT